MATKLLFANNASSQLSGTLAQGGTTLVVASGEGALFPSPGLGEAFRVTLFEKDQTGNEKYIEIVECTSRTGDTLTIDRDVENLIGAGGYAYPSQPAETVYVELRWTAGCADACTQNDENLFGLDDFAVARQNLGVEIGVDVQAYDADLDWLAANLTTAGKDLVGAASASAQRTALSLNNVTNDAQTKSAIVPNTAPSAGEVLIGNAGGTAFAKHAISGDLTLAADGTATLATSGATAGTYTKVTVDAKGRVTVGASLQAGDVPTLNQSTTGNAATATKLATARNIGGVSFDGTGDINLPGVNTAGNQNTTGSAAKWTTARSLELTGDVTATFSGVDGAADKSVAATIANGAVTNAKQANMVTSTIKGRKTAGSGAPEDLSAADARAVLDVIDMSLQNMSISAIKYALDQAALANYGVRALRQQAQQEGAFTIQNRGVVSGCALSKSNNDTRKLNLAAGVCFANGRSYSVAAANNAAYVPQNTTGGSVTVFAYLKPASGIYTLAVTAIGAALPSDAIKLYNVVIPNNSTDATDQYLANVTLTDTRRIEARFPLLLDSPASVSPVLRDLSANDYRLDFDVVSAVGAPCEAKCCVVSSRATNGFTVLLASAADDVTVRWKASKLNN